MILGILQLTHNATTLLFGVYLSAAFLGIVMKRSNILRLFGFSCATGLLYLGAFLFLGEAMTRELYPLIVHLPLILLLVLYYKYRPLVSSHFRSDGLSLLSD